MFYAKIYKYYVVIFKTSVSCRNVVKIPTQARLSTKPVVILGSRACVGISVSLQHDKSAQDGVYYLVSPYSEHYQSQKTAVAEVISATAGAS